MIILDSNGTLSVLEPEACHIRDALHLCIKQTRGKVPADLSNWTRPHVTNDETSPHTPSRIWRIVSDWGSTAQTADCTRPIGRHILRVDDPLRAFAELARVHEICRFDARPSALPALAHRAEQS